MTPERWAELLVVAGVIWVVLWQLHPSLLFSSTTITGGDTGAHLATAAYLRTSIFHLNVTPWYPGWFAGMPSYSYYFVLPDALAALGSYVIGFAVALFVFANFSVHDGPTLWRASTHSGRVRCGHVALFV
jgi:uncharacterized membrane protein